MTLETIVDVFENEIYQGPILEKKHPSNFHLEKGSIFIVTDMKVFHKDGSFKEYGKIEEAYNSKGEPIKINYSLWIPLNLNSIYFKAYTLPSKYSFDF